MPEILEIELYRRSIEPVVGRTIAEVHAPDPWFLKGGVVAAQLNDALVGAEVSALRRRGKLLLMDFVGDGPVLGLRFGMTGRPFLDDGGPLLELEYSSRRAHADWDRFALQFSDGGSLRINDPRRLGGVELDPDEDALGPDAFELTLARLRTVFHSAAPVKAVLLDQHRIAGLGNMLADEVLYRAGVDPARPARSLDDSSVKAIHRAIRRVLPELLERGGSHAGRLAVGLRVPGARCPKDGAELLRRTIGGRTTYSCPAHQR